MSQSCQICGREYINLSAAGEKNLWYPKMAKNRKVRPRFSKYAYRWGRDGIVLSCSLEQNYVGISDTIHHTETTTELAASISYPSAGGCFRMYFQ